MSYAAEELRFGIVELFADAARMGSGPAVLGGPWKLIERHGRPEGLTPEERRARRREADRRRRAALRQQRKATREACRAALMFRGPTPQPVVWERFYACPHCGSRSAAHRCPVEVTIDT